VEEKTDSYTTTNSLIALANPLMKDYSLMESSFASKMIIVLFGMFNLNGNVLDTHLKMMLYFILDHFQAPEWSCGSDVCTASIFACGKSPHVEVVNFGNTFTITNCGLELLVINI